MFQGLPLSFNVACHLGDTPIKVEKSGRKRDSKSEEAERVRLSQQSRGKEFDRQGAERRKVLARDRGPCT